MTDVPGHHDSPDTPAAETTRDELIADLVSSLMATARILSRIAELHVPVGRRVQREKCEACGHIAPCPTRRLLAVP